MRRLLLLLGVLLVATGVAFATDPIVTPNYSQAFTAETSVVLTHYLGSKNLIVACYDGSDVQISPDSVTIASSPPYSVTVTFSGSTTGRCVVNAGAGSKYYVTFTGQTSLVISSSDLALDPYRAQVICYDNGTPRKRVEPDSTEIDEGTGDFTIYFYTAQDGRCTVS